MSLTWPVVLAVLLGAALHASWNALVKSAGDKTVDTALVQPTEAVRVASNIRVLSIAPLMAEAIKRTANEQSVSSLFY